MDDRSSFSSFIFSFFKPFIFSHGKENLMVPENDEHHDEYNEPSGSSDVSPRDSLLKPDPNKKQYHNPYSNRERNPGSFFSDDFNSFQGEDFGMERGDLFGDFFTPGFHDGSFESIFRMMDEMFEKSSHFSFGDEGGYGGHNFNFPSIHGGPSIDPRNSKDGKVDEDLDSASGNEIASLLKESPSYERKPESSLRESYDKPSTSTSRFKSTSIVRIRRPDGVIEETRKYCDSDGREETEVITREPGLEDNVQPLEPFSDHSFTGIFKRFPFTIF